MHHTARISRATVSALIAPLLLAAACTAAPSDRSPSPSASDHTVPGGKPGAAAPTTSPGDDDGAFPLASMAATGQAIEVARRFAAAWSRPNLDAQTWLAGVRVYTAPHYAALLASVDPANVPATTVTGPPTPVSSTTVVLVVDVPTDAGTLRVTCDDMAGQWLVVTTGWEAR
ncbi:hypothetical protein [Rugosimonospora africana]|uniref:Lipoprotein n=1 Tax=Rugosimonospora africana TaxID=556532 RepID=A0A8J3VUS1_9ACTN|nr:hypothetical protein [Rugosimonospora africana]GIH18958.1 hypothetical protein Raf01_71300 [Rugosimonospora africana]